MIHTGCAGWRLHKPVQARFPGEGTHRARYGRHLPAVQVNSSFCRHHRRTQYAKWAPEVPAGFRFPVKMPRWLTHDQRLRDQEGLDGFLDSLAADLCRRSRETETWCIFNNTATEAGLENALRLHSALVR